MEYPRRDELAAIVDRTASTEQAEVHAALNRDQILELRAVAAEVLVASHVRDYAISVVLATQPTSGAVNALARKYIRYGSSPRGAQGLVLCGRVRALMEGRLHVSTDDIRALALPALRHRIILNFDAHADGRTEDDILLEILDTLRSGAVSDG